MEVFLLPIRKDLEIKKSTISGHCLFGLKKLTFEKHFYQK